MSLVKWGILGLGDIANSFASVFQAENAVLYAAASRSQEKADAFAKEHQIEKAYGNYDDLLADPDVDAVYIATPHNYHAEWILKSLEHGKHVFCEKAITMNSQQLQKAVALAKEKKLVISEAMTIYHMPLYRKLKNLINQGSLGKLKMMQVSFGSLKEDDPTNRFFSKDLAGGALLDIGVYALSFARFFLTSQPTEVLTTMNFHDTGVDEQSGILLKNQDDEIAVVSLSFRAKMPKQGVVAFENGYITVENYPRASQALLTRPDGSTETITAGDTKEAMNYEIADFTKKILSGESDDTIQLSQDVMELMDKLREKWGLEYEDE